MAPTPSGTKRAENPSWLKVAGLTSPLTSAEQRVLAALADGSAADVHSEGVRQPIRAGLIRAITIGLAVPVEEIDPRGLNVVGASFAECIDLDDVEFARPLRFSDCELRAGLSAQRAELHLLALLGCTLHQASTTRLSGPSPAVDLDAVRVRHGLFFDHSEIVGTIRLLDASIGGQLSFVDGKFTSDTGPVLFADGLATTSDTLLTGTFTGNGEAGAIRLVDAKIGGQLNCTGGEFTNAGGPALYADGLSTAGHAHLDGVFEAVGELGCIRLIGATIGGQLNCSGTFTCSNGPAVKADGLTTNSITSLAGDFTGNSESGAVRLLGAMIGADFYCSGTFVNPSGPALAADAMATSGSVHLEGSFEGQGMRACVRFSGARIGGQLRCVGGKFTNSKGPALNASGASVGDSLSLASVFKGNTTWGAVVLVNASVGGQLQCADATIQSTGHPGLRLDETRVEGSWVLDPAIRDHATPERWLSMNGFTYAGTPIGAGSARDLGALDWAQLLSGQTRSYAAQPYQHLAAAYRAAGHEQDAKAVLMAQQDDRRERVVEADGHRWRGLAMRLSKLFTGYGYQSWRALFWLLGLAAISVALAFVAGGVAIDMNPDPAAPAQATTVLAHKPTKTDFGAPCSAIELVGVGIDWAVPIIATKAGESCLLNSTHPHGQWWTGGSWLIHIMGWALATLAVAGFTGLIRRL